MKLRKDCKCCFKSSQFEMGEIEMHGVKDDTPSKGDPIGDISANITNLT